MKPRVSVKCSIVFLILAVIVGCGEDNDSALGPGTSSDNDPAMLELTFQYENGAALADTGIILSTYSYGQSIGTAVTDTAGYVAFDSLSVGTYKIDFKVLNIRFSEFATVSGGETHTKTIVIPTLVDVEVSVHSGYNPVPIPDTEVTLLAPERLTAVTDETGWVRFEQIPFDKYMMQVKRFDIVLIDSVVFGNFDDGTVSISQSISTDPIVDILDVDDELTFNQYGLPVILHAYVRDFEDGLLEGEQVEWWSDIDGFLVYGTDLELSLLSIGTHTITVIGDDLSPLTGSKNGEDTIVVHVTGESDVSFFPVTSGAYWSHEVVPATIVVTDNTGADEQWTLSGWEVAAGQDGSFIGSMTFEVETSGELRTGEYAVTNTYVFEGNGVQISQRTEQMTISHEPSGVDETITYTTTYDPPLVMLSDHLNPTATPFHSQAVKATVEWTYTNSISGSLSRQSMLFTQAMTETGMLETVDTPVGMMSAVPVTMTVDDEVRTMYFSQGIGIIATESSSLGFPLRTELVETNIIGTAAARIAGNSSAWGSISQAHISIQNVSDLPAQLQEYCRILRCLTAW